MKIRVCVKFTLESNGDIRKRVGAGIGIDIGGGGGIALDVGGGIGLGVGSTGTDIGGGYELYWYGCKSYI